MHGTGNEWTTVRLTAGALMSVLVVAAASGQGAPPADTCVSGFVWREAVPGDHVCVTPATRDQAAADNRAAAGRVAARPGLSARSRAVQRADGRVDRSAILIAPGRSTTLPQAPPARPDTGTPSHRGFDQNGAPYIDDPLPDGSVRRIQANGVTVIKPDGTSQFFPNMSIRSNVQPPTPPDLPADPSRGRAWVTLHNEQLLGLITELVDNDAAEMQKFSAAEATAAGADLFRQVEYRTRILEFLAKP